MNRYSKFFFTVFSIILVLVSLKGQAQKGTGCSDDLLPKLSENRNWGYADFAGEWIIEPIYSKVSPFVGGKAIVQRGILCGVIDCQGNVVLQCKYEKLANFRDNKVWAMEKGLWGLVGAKGQVLQSPQFSEINPIANTVFAWVKKNSVWGLFSEEQNKFICQPQYKVAQVMSMTASLVQTDKNYGVVNHSNCTYLVPLELTRVKKVAINAVVFEKNNLWGAFNTEGKVVINPEFDSITLKTDELLLVKKASKCGLYSFRGKKMLPVEFEEIGVFSEVYFTVKQNGKYGYCTRYGKVAIKPTYQEAMPFKNKQAIVKKGAKWGIIDYSNKFILQPEYDNIAAVVSGKFYVMTQGGKSYFFDSNFKKITDESFDLIAATDTVYAIRVKKDGKYSYYNPEAKSYVTSEKYEEAKAYENGYALVKNAGLTGVLDRNGKLILPCQYDNVVYDKLQSKIVFRILKNGKEGLTDDAGIILIPCEYDQLVPALPNYIKAKKNGKYGILRTSGISVTEFVYDYIGSTSDIPQAPEWPAMASHKGKFGLINEKGEEVYPFKGKDMSYVGNKLYVVKEGKSLLLLTTIGKTIKLNYEDVNYFGDGLAAVKKGDKWGYMTTSGEEKIKLQYEQAELFYGKLAAVKIKSKWGAIDHSGKIVVPADYESYKEDLKGSRMFSKEGKAYILQADGTLK